MSAATITRYCLCGGSLRARSTPPETAETMGAIFDLQHAGPGHGPATKSQAARARARADDEALREPTP